MALTTELRIFPNKELFAVDMAEIVNTSVPLSGIIQGCAITLNDVTGTLSIESGRILINGRLGVITEGGTLAAPTVEGSTNVKCHVVAVCNLSSTLSPFTIEIVNQATYEEYAQRRDATRDVFNVQDGFSYHYLGSVMVNPASGKIKSWTPSVNANAKKKININFNNSGGTYLPAGTNIDTIGMEYSGWWGYDMSNVSGTFPVTDNYGTFGHIHGPGGGNSAMQIIRSASQANTSSLIFMRFRTDNGWGAWQRFISANTVTLTVRRVDNGYCSASDIAGLGAVKKSGFLWFIGSLHITNDIPSNGTNYRIATIDGWNALINITLTVTNITHKATILVTISSTGAISVSNSNPQTQPSGYSNGTYRFVACVPCEDGQE